MTAPPTPTWTPRLIFDLSYLKNAPQIRHLQPPRPPFPAAEPREWPLPGELSARAGAHQGPWTAAYVGAAAHYTLGLSRYEPTEPYFLHRPTPAPRCLHTTDLHVTGAGGDGCPAGRARYNALRHTLTPSPLAGGPPGRAWSFTVHPERLAHIYGEFAVRLAVLAAGHAVEHLQVLSAHLGQPLAVQRGAGLGSDVLRGDAPLIHLVPGAAMADAPRPTLAAMLARHSGHGPRGIDPLPGPVALATAERVAGAVGPVPAGVRLYAALVRVPERAPGYYAYDPDSGTFLPVALGAPAARTLFKQFGFQADQCAMTFFLSADLSQPDWPDSGEPYAGALLACARAAQRLSWGAAAEGLFARPHLSHDEPGVDHALGLTTTAHSAVYAVAVGHDRDRGFPVRLHLPVQESS